MPSTQKISTCLWFDAQAEEAAEHYVSLFDNSRVVSVGRYGKDARMPEGLALMVVFELDGTTFHALNGGPLFPHTEAASMMVKCETQAEIDRLWARLTKGGSPGVCGWLKDRYGLSWQIVPAVIERLLTGPDETASARVMAAVMGMAKLDIGALEAAHAG